MILHSDHNSLPFPLPQPAYYTSVVYSKGLPNTRNILSDRCFIRRDMLSENRDGQQFAQEEV